MKWLWFFLILIFLADPLRAYPSFIGFGYNSCSTCHFNPLGNGPLTDYGRALSASVISARPPFVKLSDDELGEKSGLLGSPETLPEWVRLQLGYRGLYFSRDLMGSNQDRYIHMKLDGSAVLRSPDEKWIAVGNIGYAPTPATAAPGRDVSHLISREHYVGYKPSKHWGFYGGLMDVAYGIRIPDHTAYSRSRTALAQNDQTHGVLVHTSQSFGEGSVHFIGGNLQQDFNERQMGVSTQWDYEINSYSRVGASGLFTFGEYRKRQMGGVQFKWGIDGGHALLFDTGLINESPKNTSSKLGLYSLTQTHTRLIRGLHFLVTGEVYSSEIFNDSSRYFRITPGLQYFPAQRMEFRVEFQASRTTNSNPVTRDVYSLLAQVNLWL